MEHRATQIAELLRRTVTGPMWHGPALAELLAGVSVEQAAARPITGAHSIWEVVLHISVWAAIARARLAGGRTGDPAPEQDWPLVTDPTADRWSAAVAALQDSYDTLAAAVAALDDSALAATVSTRDYSFETMLRGVIEHGTYHGGQIALLKKAGARP